MINNKYKYSYNINPEANEKSFVDSCILIEKNLQGAKKENLIVDIDGSLIQKYHIEGKEIVVYDDYYVDAVYVDSNINLDDIFKKKSKI
ncbi:MAG: hypothetical protein IJ945_04050 [Oscillospiraceae bacterium]|nr:hypothetical protein [Oscillospiraceae bacterium]